MVATLVLGTSVVRRAGSSPALSTVHNIQRGQASEQTMMKKFAKLTIRVEDGNHIKKWVDVDSIKELTQHSATQWGDNEATCVFTDGTTVELIAFNETLDSLK